MACPAANLRLYQVYTQGIGVMPDAAKARIPDAAAETLGADVARMFAERICPPTVTAVRRTINSAPATPNSAQVLTASPSDRTARIAPLHW